MKKILFASSLLLIPGMAFAALQEIPPTGSWGVNAGKISDNFSELDRRSIPGVLNFSEIQTSTSVQPNTLIAYQGKIYKCVAVYVKSGFDNPATSTYFEELASGGGTGDDQTANEVPFTPNGTIASTTVQTAIQEVRDEAAPLSNVLTKDNTTAFTPDADYEPATRKFVLDSILVGGGYSDEAAQDAIGSMFNGNTETGVSISYDDANAKINATVDFSSLSSVYQPLDTDLTNIAGVSTATFGRNMLAYADAASARAGIGAEASLGNPSTNGYVLASTTSGTRSWVAAGSGSMTYPSAGVPLSTGSAWGTSYTVGANANNLVQLNSSGALPAVSGVNLTALPATAATDAEVAAAVTARVPDGTSVGDGLRWNGTGYSSGSFGINLSALTDFQLNSANIFDDTATNGDTSKVWSADKVYDQLALKQDVIVSGTNIKTVNNLSIVGSGNVDIAGTGGGSEITTLSAAPYSDVACDTSGYHSGYLYLCVSGFYTQRIAATAYSNPGGSGAWLVSDAFAADTSANYTSFGGNTLDFGTAGVVKQSGTWTDEGGFYANTSMGSANQTVQGKVSFSTTQGYNGVLLRSNGTTGYVVGPMPASADTDRLHILTTSAQDFTYADAIFFTGGKVWGTGVSHLIEVSINSSTISAKIDWNDDGDFLDTNEADMSTVTNSAITTGNYAGIAFNNNGTQVSLDDFKAKAY